ncbi:MAG: hypothetical protein KDI36_05635 [Pseudomonadales bacterium]|nr:hypothetical protein [Pseudomonadales bacterium]
MTERQITDDVPAVESQQRQIKVVGLVAVVWNLLGVSAFLMQMLMTEEDMAALPEAQRALYEAIPFWADLAFSVAVFGGLLGAVLLLLRRRLAIVLFAVSLAGIGVQQFQMYVMSDVLAVMGASAAVMPTLVVCAAIMQLWYAVSCRGRGWLN